MTPSPAAAAEPAGPPLLTRLASKLRGEVPADALEAFRDAGGAVYPMLLGGCETAAAEATLGRHPWTGPPGPGGELLAVWAALVLQVIGEALLAEDYAASPGTAGYLPPVTAEQAWACFDQVGPWLDRARSAAADPLHDLGGELALPSRFGGWVADDECPPAHLRALCGAAVVVAGHLHTLLGALLAAGTPGGFGPARVELERRFAVVRGRLDHLGALWPDRRPPGEELAARLLTEAREVLDELFVLGQLVAAPDLLGRRAALTRSPAYERLPLPGEPGFDRWCLTAPAHRDWFARQPAARRAVERLWDLDPDPARTLTIEAEIRAAARGRRIVPAAGAGPQLAFHACPWAPVWVVVRPVHLAGQRLEVLTQFAYEVSAAEMRSTGTFVRRIVRGPFVRTGRMGFDVRPA
jgi:hypothetical protein